jgi:hypothetical protein
MLGLTASAVSAMREGVRVASPKRLSLDTMSSEASRRVSSELSLVGAKRTVMVNSSVPSAVDSRMGESLEGSCAGESMEKPCVSPRVDSMDRPSIFRVGQPVLRIFSFRVVAWLYRVSGKLRVQSVSGLPSWQSR